MAATKDGSSGPGSARAGVARADLSRLAVPVLAALAAAVLVKVFVADFSVVEGVSMSPSHPRGSVVLIWKLAYGLRTPSGYLARWGEPEPGHAVSAFHDGRRVLKRVAAAGPASLEREGGGRLAVPAGTVFLVGDAPEHSNDSRDYGPVPLDAVEGRVFRIVPGTRR
ncbi:MAG: S26 family signal peptidase [Spirochaetales bacterium]|nr:S26 family signal peptidase [Spirochaetales bacterium]